MAFFSSRLPWDSPTNAQSRRLAERRARGLPVLDLTVSNPTQVNLPYPAEIRDTFGGEGVLRYRADPRGGARAREAVAAHTGVDPADLLLCASTSEAYSFLLKLLCDPGDTVLVPQPSYPLLETLARLDGVRLEPYRLAWDGEWHVDLFSLADAARRAARPRAVLLVGPNNPTGEYRKRREVAALCELAARHDLTLVSDEVFAEFPARDAPDPERVVRLATPDLPALAFSLGGLSKTCGLPQMKLAWIVAGGPGRGAALDRLETIADAYLSVATPILEAAPALLRLGAPVRRAILERVRDNRALLEDLLRDDGKVQVLPAEGGWTAVLRLPAVRDDDEIALELLDRGVLVQPGYFYDFDGCFLVVSLLVEPESLRVGAREIGRL